MLCGFLSPSGKYIECESYEHLDVATQLVNEFYPDYKIKNRIEAENKLFNEGYIELNSRGASFRFFVNHKERTLSDKQVAFLEENLTNTNNDDQLNEIKSILRMNTDLKEELILSTVENRVCL